MKNIYAVLLLALALSAAAASKEPAKPADFPKPLMCNGQYALCIKAPCTKTQDANHDVKCACVIENGWNMGPAKISCDQRASSLVSTYSNLFNTGSSTISCPAPTDWAWCYGASCDPDPKDPTKKVAICKCPVLTSATVILTKTEKCGDTSICRQLWSGALKGESKFANEYYEWWMNHEGHPTNPAAPACPTIDYKK